MSFKAKIRFCTFYTIVFRVLKSINLLWCIKAKNGRLFSCTKKHWFTPLFEKNAFRVWAGNFGSYAWIYEKKRSIYLLYLGRFYFRQ